MNLDLKDWQRTLVLILAFAWLVFGWYSIHQDAVRDCQNGLEYRCKEAAKKWWLP
jgi:hypothetical protein